MAADKPRLPHSVRLAAYLFPPAGIFLLWRVRDLVLRRKIFGTVGILLYCVIYAAAIVGLLIVTTGLQMEWRGGFPPVLTYSKTVPNYDAVEADRAKKSGTNTVATAPAATSDYWNGFRGPNRDGHYTEGPISTNWSNGLPLLWKQPCGSGYASFAIAEGLAFTIEQRREEEVVVAYDVASGREVWTHRSVAKFDEPLGGEGPRATPAYSDGKVYSIGGLGALFCFEAATGKVLWRKNMLGDNSAELLTYGTAASPLVVEEKLIVCPGGPNGRSVVAYHKDTGERIWGSLDDEAAYGSPMLVELAGQRQLLIVTESRAVGLSVESGELFWSFPWKVKLENRNIAQPVLLASNRFFLSAGYGTGCAAVEVEKAGPGFKSRELWRNRNLKNKFTSSVFHEGHVYGLDEDILVCLDAQTGERKWKEGRYGYGQLLLARGHLVILAGDGALALVQANPQSHVELSRFQAITGKTWNHPAISSGKLFIRNMVEMACFDIAPK